MPSRSSSVARPSVARSAGAPLRLAYILPGFCADESDWCIPVITNFIRSMSEVADVVIYTAWPYRRSSSRIHGAMVHTLSEGEPKGVRRLALWREYRRRIRHDHATQPFDLIHGFWATEPGYLATTIAATLGIPSIVSLAGGELVNLPQAGYGAQRHPWLRYFVSRSLSNATAITAGSPWFAATVGAKHRGKLSTIPLGVDTWMFPPAPVRQGERLLAAASMIPLKDYPTLLEGIAIARRDFPLLKIDLAGDGVERPMLEAMVARLGLHDVVTFLGHVSYDDMPALFASHDLFLHSSLHEAQGMVVLEALATGLPVIATDTGIAHSLPDSLLYKFTAGNPDDLGRALIRSLGDPNHSSKAASHGPALIQGHYSLERAREGFLALYWGIDN